MKRSDIRGQATIELSFGMIFSIILIVIFLSVAGFVIFKFVDFGKGVDVNLFVDEFEREVEGVWRSSGSSIQRSWNIPEEIEFVCFADLDAPPTIRKDIYDEINRDVFVERPNMFFWPVGSSGSTDAVFIEHLNISKITEFKNPNCIESIKGKVSFTIEKDFREALVTIK
jgi:hypothetical protein